MKQDICDIYCYDEEKVTRTKAAINDDEVKSVSGIFKVLGDPTRLSIAYALMKEEELCVCDVANIIDSSIATASHHLRTMKKQGLAKYRKEGKLAFYSLDDEHVESLIHLAFEHHREEK
ncbi:ArsR/SmtB family transcription factor [Evansella halocellulosilytica]|uniref:ArsR/SmtB family transcription factor n=1 Tax=Evansella halocellulosilytica TaxID=2011013 RepID=UPI000BB98526|nr:metalloregulator ArsR/SmtB family transcription factor [Evansella halocellulosilytica]